METAKGATVTFTPIYQGKYLFVQRHKDDPVLAGYWAFPGGKVVIGETIADTMVRECREEVGLELTGRTFFVDSYLLGNRFGLHLSMEVTSDNVVLGEDHQDFAWVSGLEELQKFTPRIPGIDNHLHYTLKHLSKFARAARLTTHPTNQAAILDLAWTDLSQLDLVEHRFLNRA